MKYSNKKVTTFKERLNDICDATEQTDAEIARNVKVSKQTLSAWRIGTRSPREPMISILAEYFGVTIEWLMGFDTPMRPDRNEKGDVLFSQKEIELIKMYRFIDERGKENVDETITREYERAKEKEKKESEVG